MLLLSLHAPLAAAYGKIGHWLSGRVASAFLSNDAAELVYQLLKDDSESLADAASWADEIKSDHRYDWSKQLHYINPVGDHPPEVCSYNPSSQADCPGDKCIVGAIMNYTSRLRRLAGAYHHRLAE
eukprot:jgi/Hompol1/1755/HPOL_000011-RA